MNIEHRLYINAPVEEVFRLVDDLDNLKLWMDDLVEARYLNRQDQGSAVGARFSQQIREGNRLAGYEGEILDHDHLRRIALVIGNHRFIMKVEYRFVGDGEQTRLDYRAHMVEGSWFMRWTGRLFESFTRRIIQNQLWRLKTVAEASQPLARQAEERLAA